MLSYTVKLCVKALSYSILLVLCLLIKLMNNKNGCSCVGMVDWAVSRYFHFLLIAAGSYGDKKT